jgi:hypothetical protein
MKTSRPRIDDPRAFGRVGVLMGEPSRFGDALNGIACGGERPAKEGRAGGWKGRGVTPRMASQSRPGSRHA